MSDLVAYLVAVLLAYLLGSIPFAIVTARWFGLADPRRHGSGNPGATNVLRGGNKLAALLTLLGDAGKGALAVALAYAWFGPASTLVYLVALCAFLGHLFPVYIGFRGGKGVATAAGILLALDWMLGLFVVGVWVVVAYMFRYSSLAAVSAALAAPLYLFFTLKVMDGSLALVMCMSFLLLFRHRTNLSSLLAGKEDKIGQRGQIEKRKR